MNEQATITVRLVRSLIGHPEKHRAIVRGMGLRKLQSAVTIPNTPQMRGMINKVKHLVRVES